MAAALHGGDFTVSHAPAEGAGWVEVLRDGLTFDLRGLSGSAPQALPTIEHSVGISIGHNNDLAALLICPGPHLSGAQRLLPVIRVAAALTGCLAKIAQPRAICWVPARNAVAPELFNRAVQPWLEGGPFPAIALASLQANESGAIATTGLKFLIGQEFTLSGSPGTSREHLARVAVRLIDWLVAHGPIAEARQVDLAGTGAVFLEAENATSIIARCS
ncbi:hypothetical protein [Novosphingobium sp. AAP83]|uniref:hypothetical protein n=1 Tax=Novosphingobium sp. AAP83 TaxID=1523425 RepID=UPI0006B8D747|nr:hypothetical protein [Novosphingobium sp. AAP83]